MARTQEQAASVPLELSGVEKASVLLMSLGPEASEEVMSRLSPEERDVLGAQMVRMRSVQSLSKGTSVVREQVLEEVRELIRSGAALHQKGGSPFAWLDKYEPDRLMRMLAGERPRTIALILSYLSPRMVAAVMRRLDEKTRDRVAAGLAEGGLTPDDVVATIEETMRKRASDPLRHKRSPPPAGAAAQ